MRVSSNTILQKYDHPTSHYVMTLLSAQNLSDSNFSEAAICLRQGYVWLLRPDMEVSKMRRMVYWGALACLRVLGNGGLGAESATI